MLIERLKQYAYLMRLDKPIGILLLLWPTWWALMLASNGKPSWQLLVIFTTGVILMRSAGCVVNDLADRKFDGKVKRTANRPLVLGTVKPIEALMLASMLAGLAFFLVLFCNRLTLYLALLGAVFAVFYPFMKRFTHLPQCGLSIAFSWGVPMAFAAQKGFISDKGWWLFASCLIWPMIYDTYYAMIDREDDSQIGIRSTAILFGKQDKKIIGMLQIVFLISLLHVGYLFSLKWPYYLSLFIAGILFIYQQWLTHPGGREDCFKAFVNNQWVGFFIFIGLLINYLCT